MFADTAELEVVAGKGGDGALSFRREKYIARGGPDGGNGGKGGDVLLVADHNANTLSKYRTTRSIKANPGEQGGSNKRNGKAGEDVLIYVPTGTVVYEDGKQLVDLGTNGARVVIAEGGRGGFGNAHFVSSTRQAPRIAEKGEEGQKRLLHLELKLVADVGLVGLPSAGKSTFLSVISNARPEIGDYPFTTLKPNLGVVQIDDGDMVVADMPGLIEGASLGKGLGDEFLRHIERTSVLVHLIDVHSDDVVADYQTITKELQDYGHGLIDKPRIVVLSKTDSIDQDQLKSLIKELKKVAAKLPIMSMSAIAKQNVQDVLRAVYKIVEVDKQARLAAEPQEDDIPIIELETPPDYWTVTLEEPGVYRVVGARMEGFARRTNWDSTEGVERLRDIMRKVGVAKELRKLGAKPGDTVRINDNQLEWL
jgi:GTP-binding protein